MGNSFFSEKLVYFDHFLTWHQKNSSESSLSSSPPPLIAATPKATATTLSAPPSSSSLLRPRRNSAGSALLAFFLYLRLVSIFSSHIASTEFNFQLFFSFQRRRSPVGSPVETAKEKEQHLLGQRCVERRRENP